MVCPVIIFQSTTASARAEVVNVSAARVMAATLMQCCFSIFMCFSRFSVCWLPELNADRHPLEMTGRIRGLKTSLGDDLSVGGMDRSGNRRDSCRRVKKGVIQANGVPQKESVPGGFVIFMARTCWYRPL